MGDELKDQFNTNIELVAGSNGVFDITVNGNIIFSKAQTGRYPEPGEVISLIQSL